MDYQYPIRRVSGRCIGRCTVKTFSGRNPSMKFQTVNVPPSAASVCYVSHGYSSGGASLPFTKSLMTPTRALNTPVVANLLSSLFIYLHKYLQNSFLFKKRTGNNHAQAPLPCILIWVVGWKAFWPSMKLITPVFVCSWPWKGDSYVMNWTSIIMIASSLTLSTENLSKTRWL